MCELDEKEDEKQDRDCTCKILLEVLASGYSLIAHDGHLTGT